MAEQFQHGMLEERTADENARQNFVKSLKIHLAAQVSPGNKEVYEARVEPEFVKKRKRVPRNRHEIRKVMERNLYYQMWSSLQRTSQEMMWESIGSSVGHQLPQLIKKSKKLANGKARGTLTLDPALEIPRYHTAVDIHCMPGGYHTELTEDDVFAGAVYDRAVYIYAMGRMGDRNQDMGRTVISYIKENHPDFEPKRILDLGCAVGHSTLPYVDSFPGAEVYGVDVAAPMLRYAHARAEALGKTVHFSQQNAEHMHFEDESFDLIVSQILLHETSNKALDNILKECFRLLKPGGLMLHAEVPQYARLPTFDQFMLDWDTYYNNEPFWGLFHDKDVYELCTRAGFRRANVIEAMQPMATERTKERTDKFESADFAGGGAWYILGARK